ncbi:MAG: DUF3820 family protein [Marinilabiliaceae bacterium]|nr:DUF3820 family protein [Marinilabiliaceae bacterium]
MEEPVPDKTILTDIVNMTMPYGRYAGQKLVRLPERYLVWMHSNNAFPKGRLGMLLQTLYEIKLNGLEFLLHDIN